MRDGEEGKEQRIGEDRDGERTSHARINRLWDEDVPDESDRVQERGEEDEITCYAVGKGKSSAHSDTARGVSGERETASDVLPPEHPVEELLRRLPGRCVRFPGFSNKREALADCCAQRIGVVAADIETAAPRRSLVGERRDDEVTPLGNSSPGQFDIPAAVRRIGQEVEHGPVVPDFEGADILSLSDIGRDPFDTLGTRAEPRPGFAQGGFGNVEDGDSLEGKVKQPIDEPRGSAANVDDSTTGSRSDRSDELK